MYFDKEVEKIEVIRTALKRRGTGIGDDEPVRAIIQYWTLDGSLLAEVDQWAEAQRIQAQRKQSMVR